MRTLPASISVNHCIDRAHLRAYVLLWDFNRRLTEDAQCLPNEAQFEQWLEELTRIDVPDPRMFWLTLARLTELVLKQAADYADNCEFKAAGDLLVNPRRIEIFVQGKIDPVIKKRHGGLHEQFASAIGKEDPAAWLSRKTLSHICDKALIPCLKEQLSASGWICPDYLATLDRQMGRVTHTIAFLTAWQIADFSDLSERMAHASHEDRAFIAANLCRFDRDRFDAMGGEIERIVNNVNTSGRFLRQSQNPVCEYHPIGTNTKMNQWFVWDSSR